MSCAVHRAPETGGLTEGRIRCLRASARHFLVWLDQEDIDIGVIDDAALRRFAVTIAGAREWNASVARCSPVGPGSSSPERSGSFGSSSRADVSSIRAISMKACACSSRSSAGGAATGALPPCSASTRPRSPPAGDSSSRTTSRSTGLTTPRPRRSGTPSSTACSAKLRRPQVEPEEDFQQVKSLGDRREEGILRLLPSRAHRLAGFPRQRRGPGPPNPNRHAAGPRCLPESASQVQWPPSVMLGV